MSPRDVDFVHIWLISPITPIRVLVMANALIEKKKIISSIAHDI